jgi:hypothetical protein
MIQLLQFLFFMEQCCKKMPKIINMKSVKECLKSFRRPAPPQGNPGGPPPPTGSPSGPLPTGSTSELLPTESTNAPPPPPRGDTPPPGEEVEEFDEKDVGEPVKTLGDAKNSSTSGKLQKRPRGKVCKCKGK